MRNKKNGLKKTKSECALVGASLIVGFFVVWFFCVTALKDFDLLCWIEAHQGLAAWVQAIGAIVAIFFAGRQVAKQISFSKEQQYYLRAVEEMKFVGACKEIAGDACDLLEDLSLQFRGCKQIDPASKLDELEVYIEVLSALLSQKIELTSVSYILIVVSELIKAKVAINEYIKIKSDRDLQSKLYDFVVSQGVRSEEGFQRAVKAKMGLVEIYNKPL